MFNINDYVHISNLNITGYITKICDNNMCYVKSNDKTIYTNISNLKKIDKDINSVKNNIEITFKTNNTEFIPEIMLRHQHLEEAIINLDKYISDATIHHCKQIKIIHGRHGGVLRNGVHDYLKKSPFVKEFHLGDYYEGSYGVTIAYLK